MACKCSPSLVRLMAAFAARGHVNSGCCGDEAHQARVSDHNPDASGYAHAQDIHEKTDHDMQPYVDYVMAHPAKFKDLVKYKIYEGFIYYPNDGARPAGKYVYTGPNAHAGHLHVSIHSTATHYAGSWYVDEAYGDTQEDDMTPEQAEQLAEVRTNLVEWAMPAITRLDNEVREAIGRIEAKVDDLEVSGGAVDLDALADKLADKLAARLAD